MSFSFSILARKRTGFTLVELLIVIAIVAVLATIVLFAVNPKKSFIDSYDAVRKNDTKQIDSALYQKIIDDWDIAGGGVIEEGEERAKPICKNSDLLTALGIICPGSAVSLDMLSPEYIASLPVDPTMPETDPCTGYMIYMKVGRPRVVAANMGKLPGEAPVGMCGTGDVATCGDGVKMNSEECDIFEIVTSCIAGTVCNASCVCEAEDGPSCPAPNTYAGPETGIVNVNTNEDTQLVISTPGVLQYFPGAISAHQLSRTVRGYLAFNPATGAFSYKPFDNFNGRDGFQFRTFDGVNYSDAQWAVITVNSVNDIIVAAADIYITDRNTILNIPIANGVLDNDSGLEPAETLTVNLLSDPSHGSVNLQTNGSFIYQPESDFTGTDSFTYNVNDGTGDSNIAVVSILIKEPGATFDGVESVTVNDGTTQRSMVTSVTVRFKTLVTLDAGAFTLTNRKTTESVTLQVTASQMPAKTVVTLTFSGLSTEYDSLADGNYLLSIDGSKVHAGASLLHPYQFGTVPADLLYRFVGDVQGGDRDVDGVDYLRFRSSSGLSLCNPLYLDYCDINGDNTVGATDDLLRMMTNYRSILSWE